VTKHLAFAALLILVCAEPVRACSWVTPEYADNGRADLELAPNRPAPDVRIESFEHFRGVAGTSCDEPVDILRLSVSVHHLQDASLTFERLPGSVGGSPIPAGSFVSDHADDGRVWFNFVSSPVAPGRLLLRAWTVSPTGRRSEATTVVVDILPR
jgi:hypothetical protein